MELTSLEKREILLDTLQQIRQSCENLMSWNKDVKDMKVLLNSSTGMQDLDVISDVVNNDLQPLLEAIDYFVEYLKNKV